MEIGDIIQFGFYGGEPLEFEVKDIFDNTALLVSKNIIEVKDFETESPDYYESKLRQWLNNEFFNIAFNDEEKEKIQIYFDDDRVCMLNDEEYEEYFPDTDKIKLLTAHASNELAKIMTDSFFEDDEYAPESPWFYRVRSENAFLYVNDEGMIMENDEYNPIFGIVPSLLIEI